MDSHSSAEARVTDSIPLQSRQGWATLSLWRRHRGVLRSSCCCSVISLFFIFSLLRMHFAEHIRVRGGATLVLYTFSATDAEYIQNLEFFVNNGMREEDGCEYYIIVQGDGTPPRNRYKLPKLPKNAHYVHHKNSCYDWGTFGWALFSLGLNIDAFSYFIFMNSSVRGPYLPPFWPDAVHWSKVFKMKLTEKVKLVGSTISCEPVREGGRPRGNMRHNAHVQSYVVATDWDGLQILLDNRRIFQCHQNIADAVYNAEVGASLAIFRAGYSIDSLMLRYQGIDWTDKRNWDCNARLNPYAEYAYDGIGLNPLEVLFVKVKRFQRETDWATTSMAIKYDKWLSSRENGEAVNSNEYNTSPMRFRMGKIIQMQLRGSKCFDFDHYRQFSPDITRGIDDREVWEEFVNTQQFTGRRFRFLCKSPFFEEAVVGKLLRWQSQIIETDRQQ